MNILFAPRVRTMSSRIIGLALAVIVAMSFSEWHFQAPFVEHILWFFGWLFVGLGIMEESGAVFTFLAIRIAD